MIEKLKQEGDIC